jgi:hypothetical protein
MATAIRALVDASLVSKELHVIKRVAKTTATITEHAIARRVNASALTPGKASLARIPNVQETGPIAQDMASVILEEFVLVTNTGMAKIAVCKNVPRAVI